MGYSGFMLASPTGYDIHPGYPDNRDLTPAALRAVQAFVNTLDREHGIEGFATPDGLRRFLTDFGLAERGLRIAEPDLAHALEVRDSLRDLFVARAGGPCSKSSVRLLEHAAREGGLTVRIDGHQPLLVATAAGLAGALGQLIASVQTAAADGSLRRLKACRRSSCQWLFWDNSPPASGVWCSMAICGNRTKVGRHRARAVTAR
jgi:predicted RNA-binding Zn ribbon-like protein